jgi:hypothetical protein
MKIELIEKQGYGPNAYLIQHQHWTEMTRWLYQNDVDYWQLSSSPWGIGFQVKGDNIEWFNLKWL